MEASKIQQLIDHAIKVRDFSQARYSNFQVGAALETNEGEIFTGCNVESSSYGLSICAERVALTKALSEGKNTFKAMAIVGPGSDYCPPCGACRQLLHDYAPDIKIILTNNVQIKLFDLKELIPFAFEESKLKKK